MSTDERRYVTTIRPPTGCQMYLWEDKEDENDDIEINWINEKIEEAKKAGYVRGQQQKN